MAQLPFPRRFFIYFAALFILALVPRLYGAHTVGWNWDAPGSFTLLNFDEAGSCRAALGGFNYSTFIGRQTIALAELQGYAVPQGVAGDAAAAKAYCHSVGHIMTARYYAAVSGALTVVVVGIIALLLLPGLPQVAFTAAALLALSGFHISESQTGTVDAPSVFYVYLFFAMLIYALKHKRVTATWLSPLFLLPAIWTKYWVFAIFAYLSVIPTQLWQFLGQGLTPRRLVSLIFATAIVFAALSNSAFVASGWYPLLGLYYVLVPWTKIRRSLIPVFLLVPAIAYGLSQVDVIADFTMGKMTSNFGTGYAAIGWNKWLRNLVNVPVILIMGLGLPACWFIPIGIRAILKKGENAAAWLCLAPVAVFALYMLLVAPVTYYRHYLALIPAAAIVASYGLWSTRLPVRRWFYPLFLPCFFIWPTLLAIDIEMDYQNDPRIELRQWYNNHPGARVFISYYVSPSPEGMAQSRFFKPEYAFAGAATLKQANYLILSENWYDTAFANELNGPITKFPQRLIKTKPEYVAFYRSTLAGEQPNLKLDKAINVGNFMPELLLHKRFYGTFQMFVGDIKVYEVVQ